ncbi:50S ribosomal protein L4 [Candidatus Peregrinibacteria bacterium]|nr:50S ribosomal protein L4 [Candidatus Peregrinibacteria bacterium]
MNIDVYTATGSKKGTLSLPSSLFDAVINEDLMHQAVMRQQANRRYAIAHARNRGEMAGSTRKLYGQKHTGRARRGPIRSPLLRGGGKAFGPRNTQNFSKDMPKSMRRAALLSCLSLQAKNKAIVGLENYPETAKTKDAVSLLKKLPVEFGRNILVVLPDHHKGLFLSLRNVPHVKTLTAAYLNPEDLLRSRHIIFLVDAVKKAEELFGKVRGERVQKRLLASEEKPILRPRSGQVKPMKPRKPTNDAKAPKKPSAKKSSSKES